MPRLERKSFHSKGHTIAASMRRYKWRASLRHQGRLQNLNWRSIDRAALRKGIRRRRYSEIIWGWWRTTRCRRRGLRLVRRLQLMQESRRGTRLCALTSTWATWASPWQIRDIYSPRTSSSKWSRAWKKTEEQFQGLGKSIRTRSALRVMQRMWRSRPAISMWSKILSMITAVSSSNSIQRWSAWKRATWTTEHSAVQSFTRWIKMRMARASTWMTVCRDRITNKRSQCWRMSSSLRASRAIWK